MSTVSHDEKVSYEEWLERVNTCMQTRLSLEVKDWPDFNWPSCYHQGIDPLTTTYLFLEEQSGVSNVYC